MTQQFTMQLLIWRRRAHEFLTISAVPPTLTFAEVQKLTGNGHQPLQHEAAQYEDSSLTSGEEYSAIGPGQSEASASGDPASASGESTDPKNQAPREDNIKSPKSQLRLPSRNHFVIYRRGCERNWVIELRSNFQKKDREQREGTSSHEISFRRGAICAVLDQKQSLIHTI